VSPFSLRAYVRRVADFAQHFNKLPNKLGAEEIRRQPTARADRVNDE
jgi:hypothetical protein